MVSPSSTNPRVTQAGDYIFRVCFIDPFQGAVMAKFAANTLKAKKVAILVDVRSDYSVGLQTFFREQFKQLGGEIVSEQSYSQGDSDFRAQLTQIKAINPDAIYVPGYYTEVGTIARQARELGIARRSRCWAATAGTRPSSGRSAARRLNGCYLSNHYSADDPSPLVQKFVSDYKATLQAGARRAGRPRLRRGQDHGGRHDPGRARPDGTEGARRPRRDQGLPGRDREDHDQRGTQRRQARPSSSKVENGKFVYVETVTP